MPRDCNNASQSGNGGGFGGLAGIMPGVGASPCRRIPCARSTASHSLIEASVWLPVTAAPGAAIWVVAATGGGVADALVVSPRSCASAWSPVIAPPGALWVGALVSAALASATDWSVVVARVRCVVGMAKNGKVWKMPDHFIALNRGIHGFKQTDFTTGSAAPDIELRIEDGAVSKVYP
jgi:hypothetical protein